MSRFVPVFFPSLRLFLVGESVPMKQIIKKMVNSLRKEHPPTFEECMATLSNHLAQLSPPCSPKSPFNENWMVFDSASEKAFILRAHRENELVDLTAPHESMGTGKE